jgi:tetratricopeptide (TPR) repeat protein
VHDSFNPYQQWLGLSLAGPPRDHYELLGLETFESDPEAIRQAADKLISRVRSVRPGEHLRQWQELIDQLKQAKTDLLDPSAKGRYDAHLRGGRGAAAPPPNLATPPTMARPPSTDSGSSPPNAPGPSSSQPATNQSVPSNAPPPATPHQQYPTGQYGASPYGTSPDGPQQGPAASYGAHGPPQNDASQQSLPHQADPAPPGYTPPPLPTSDPSANQGMGAWRKPAGQPDAGGPPQQPGHPPSSQATPYPHPHAPASQGQPPHAAYPGYGTEQPAYPGQQPDAYSGQRPGVYSGQRPDVYSGQQPGGGPYPGYPQHQPSAMGYQPPHQQPAPPEQNKPPGGQPEPPQASGHASPGPAPAVPNSPQQGPPMGTPVSSADSGAPPTAAPVGAVPVGSLPGQNLSVGSHPQQAGYGHDAPMGAAPADPFAVGEGAGRGAPVRKPGAAPPWWASPAFYVRLAVLGAILGGVTYLYWQKKGHLPFLAASDATSQQSDESTDGDGRNEPNGTSTVGSETNPNGPSGSRGHGKPNAEPDGSTARGQPSSDADASGPSNSEVGDNEQNGGANGGKNAGEKGETEPGAQDNANGDAEGNAPGEEGDQEPEIDPAQQKAVAAKFNAARAAMAQRNLQQADQILSEAAGMVQGPEQKSERVRLEKVNQRLGEFWSALRRFTANLTGGEELEIKDTRVAVVESSPEEIVLKAAGRLRRYSVADMPTLLAMSIADKTFADDPQSQLLYGVFLAMDPEGDRGKARALIQSAVQALPKEKDLLDELQVPLPASVAGSGGGSGASSGAPIPTDQAMLQAAERDVRRKFETEFGKATNPEVQAELAETLLAEAETVGGDTARRWVLLREARNLAAAAGEPQLACKVVDRMGAAFALNALQAKAAVLEEIATKNRSRMTRRTVVDVALPLVSAAAKDDRWDEAEKLAEVAVNAAVRAKSPAHARQAAAARKMVQQRRPRN